MVEILEIPMHGNADWIKQKIRTKVRGCGLPQHWLLREPIKSNEVLWLRPKIRGRVRGKQVQVRRVLYYLEYGGMPLKAVTMVCRVRNCVNPAHMRVTGFEAECNQKIERQIERGWLRPEEAENWFGWENKHNINIPHDFKIDMTFDDPED
jgi:hypothetical protein